MILRSKRDGSTVPYEPKEAARLVHRLRDKLRLPATFTLDACRHGGMTELEEAELTDGQGRALSGHRTQAAYAGYAKRTLVRALPATRKRYAHMKAHRRHWRSTPRIQREQAFRMTPGKSFRMITQPTKRHLPNPWQCLTYTRLGGSVPSGKGGGL